MRQRFKKVAEAAYFGAKPKEVSPPSVMDQYADYTKRLETKYTDLYQAHAEMKKQFGMMRDYFKHPSFIQFKRCLNMLDSYNSSVAQTCWRL